MEKDTMKPLSVSSRVSRRFNIIKQGVCLLLGKRTNSEFITMLLDSYIETHPEYKVFSDAFDRLAETNDGKAGTRTRKGAGAGR